MKKTIIFLLLLTSGVANAQGNNYKQNYQTFDSLALTPPMGWNSWNKFGCNVNEKLIREVADALVSTGMKNAGYTYSILTTAGTTTAWGLSTPMPSAFRRA